MKLINTEGMAFIGPGSEWFWTALSGLVLAVTFLAIYRQLSLQRSAGAIEQLAGFDHEWSSERMLRHKLAFLTALNGGADLSAVAFGSTVVICNFWERIASLTQRGHIDPKLLWNGTGRGCPAVWLEMAPFVRDQRTREGDPTICEHFEWLAGVMTEMDRRAGVSTLDVETLRTALDRRISSLRDQIHVEEALRTVIAAPRDAPTVGQPRRRPQRRPQC